MIKNVNFLFSLPWEKQMDQDQIVLWFEGIERGSAFCERHEVRPYRTRKNPWPLHLLFHLLGTPFLNPPSLSLVLSLPTFFSQLGIGCVSVRLDFSSLELTSETMVCYCTLSFAYLSCFFVPRTDYFNFFFLNFWIFVTVVTGKKRKKENKKKHSRERRKRRKIQELDIVGHVSLSLHNIFKDGKKRKIMELEIMNRFVGEKHIQTYFSWKFSEIKKFKTFFIFNKLLFYFVL